MASNRSFFVLMLYIYAKQAANIKSIVE